MCVHRPKHTPLGSSPWDWRILMCLMLHEMKGWTACQQQRSLMGLSPQAVQCSGLARRYFRTTATPATGSSTHTKQVLSLRPEKPRCYFCWAPWPINSQLWHGVCLWVQQCGLEVSTGDSHGRVAQVTTPDTGIQVGCPFLSWLFCFRSNSLPVYQREQK